MVIYEQGAINVNAELLNRGGKMKAILVVDLPDDIFIDDCRIEFRVIENVMEMCVEDGVKRLKPMPEKMNELSADDTIDEINGRYNINIFKLIELAEHRGYNICIDKISGETE